MGDIHFIMKTLMLGLTLLGFAGVSYAMDKAELDQRIKTLEARFDAMQQDPQKRIPADNLNKAQGIVMMERTKAGFIFAYEGGGGIALVKDPKTEKWGPVGFMGGSEASLGFLVGGQQSFIVVLLMTTNANRLLTGSDVNFGGEARGTAGNQSAGASGTVQGKQPEVLVYDDRQGLYGGAEIKGGSVFPDDNANRIYYGQTWAMSDILSGKGVKPTDPAIELGKRITYYSQPPKK